MVTSVIQPQLFKQNRNKWWLVLGLFALSLVPLGILTEPVVPGRSVMAAYVTVACLSSFFLLPTLYVALFTKRAFLQTDEHGLRWRGAFRERIAAWEEITDFYEKPTGKGHLRSVVETTSGKLTLNDFLDDSADLLLVRETVQARATSAASTRWQPLADKTAIELPKTFVYKPSALWGMRLHFLGSCAIGTFFTWPFFSSARDLFNFYGWLLTLLFAFIMLVFGALFPWLSIVAFRGLRRELPHRKHQRITVSERGLTFEDEGIFIESAWDEISEYSRRHLPVISLYVIETRNGTFDFITAISDFRVLNRLIEQRAPQRLVAAQRDEDLADLGGEAARWSGGGVGQGERIFRYRTRVNRAVLWLPTGLSLVALGMMALLPLLFAGTTPPQKSSETALRNLIMIPVALAGWWPYFKMQIRIGENGVTRRGLRGETFIAWQDVREYSRDETFGSFQILGTNQRIGFWPVIADVEELKSEIARRATNAQKRGWEALNGDASDATNTRGQEERAEDT